MDKLDFLHVGASSRSSDMVPWSTFTEFAPLPPFGSLSLDVSKRVLKKMGRCVCPLVAALALAAAGVTAPGRPPGHGLLSVAVHDVVVCGGVQGPAVLRGSP